MRIHNIKKNLYHSPMYLPNRFDNDQDNQLIFAVTEDYQGGEAKLSIDTALCGIKHPALPSGSTSLSISSPSMAIKNIASPIRRRNNYTSSNNGPVFSATKQEAPVFTAQKSSQ